MPDSTNTQATEGSNNSQEGTTLTQGNSFSPITTLEEYNAVSSRIRKEEASKYPDYSTLQAKAAQLDKIEEANKTEQQKLQDRLTAAEAEAARLKNERQVEEWKAAISKSTGVPVDVLHGATEAEIQAVAESVKPHFVKTKTPVVPGSGDEQSSSSESGDFLGDALRNKRKGEIMSDYNNIIGFWSSDILTGTQTIAVTELFGLVFWSSHILTGTQTPLHTDASYAKSMVEYDALNVPGYADIVLKKTTQIFLELKKAYSETYLLHKEQGGNSGSSSL